MKPVSKFVVADELSPFRITPFAFVLYIVFSALFWKNDEAAPAI